MIHARSWAGACAKRALPFFFREFFTKLFDFLASIGESGKDFVVELMPMTPAILFGGGVFGCFYFPVPIRFFFQKFAFTAQLTDILNITPFHACTHLG